MQISLIAIDVDETLLDSSNEISKENIKAIKIAQEKGIYVALASGRSPETVIPIAKVLGLNGYCIFYNGGLIQSCLL